MFVKFKKWNCEISFAHYRNFNTAIELIQVENGDPIAKATVNPGFDLPGDEVAIKSYSENKGMLEALIEAGVVNRPHRVVESGYVLIPICKLTPQAVRELDREIGVRVDRLKGEDF